MIMPGFANTTESTLDALIVKYVVAQKVMKSEITLIILVWENNK